MKTLIMGSERTAMVRRKGTIYALYLNPRSANRLPESTQLLDLSTSLA